MDVRTHTRTDNYNLNYINTSRGAHFARPLLVPVFVTECG